MWGHRQSLRATMHDTSTATARSPHKTQSLIANLFLLLSTILFCLICLEVTLQVADLGLLTDTSDTQFFKHSTYSPFLMFGPHVSVSFGQTNGPAAVWNAQGFRLDGDLPLKKPDNEYRIIAIGGSTTENLDNGMNLHYPEEARKLLLHTSHHRTINIVNSGMAGFSTAQSLIRLQFDLLAFHPDMITVMHNINDLMVNVFPQSEYHSAYADKYFDPVFARTYDIRDTFIGKLRIAVFFGRKLMDLRTIIAGTVMHTPRGDLVSTMKTSSLPMTLRAADEFKNNLIAIAAIAKAHNIRVVFMSQPAVFTEAEIGLAFGQKEYNARVSYPQIAEFKSAFEYYNAIIALIARTQDVYYIDMYSRFGHDEKYFNDMVHYNVDGVHRFAEIYAHQLDEILEAEHVE